MAKIRIDDFELESYEHGWQLSKLHTATKGAHAGKVVNGDYTYHPNLSAALRAIQERIEILLSSESLEASRAIRLQGATLSRAFGCGTASSTWIASLERRASGSSSIV